MLPTPCVTSLTTNPASFLFLISPSPTEPKTHMSLDEGRKLSTRGQSPPYIESTRNKDLLVAKEVPPHAGVCPEKGKPRGSGKASAGSDTTNTVPIFLRKFSVHLGPAQTRLSIPPQGVLLLWCSSSTVYEGIWRR